MIFYGIFYPFFLTLQLASTFQDFGWLDGTWASVRPNGSTRLETWAVQSDSLMTGAGMKITGTDTVLVEMLKIHQQGHEMYYVPTVMDQNQGQAVLFKLVRQQEKTFIFENPAHDFPQRIVYTFRPIAADLFPKGTQGDTLDVQVASLSGEGFQLRFFRK